MKKLLLLVTAISITFGAYAQKGKVSQALSFIEAGTLDKAKEALDEAKVNEKTKEWPNTYFALGKLCQAVFASSDSKYSSYFSDPLAEAYSAYEKAISLDPKGSMQKRIITGLVYNSLASDLFNQGSERFEAKDYEGALSSFSKQIEITESDKYAGALDTGMYYNAGLAGYNAKKYAQAKKYFEKCVEYGYLDATPNFQIYECMMAMGDTLEAEQFMLALPSKYPDNKDITLQLIDHYIKSNKYDKAQEYITVAKQADPNNFSLYFAAGIMFLNQNDFDPAIENLTKSIELKDDMYDSQYGLGVAYINKAAALFLKANDIEDANAYNAAITEANDIYAKALPYMERAHELNQTDIYTLRNLSELYYRLRQKDASLNAKYEDIRAKIKAIEGN